MVERSPLAQLPLHAHAAPVVGGKPHALVEVELVERQLLLQREADLSARVDDLEAAVRLETRGLAA